MRISVLVAAILVVQQHLDRLDELLRDGVQQGVLGVHLVIDEQLHHLEILVVDGHQQGGSAQRVDTVDVDVPLRFGLLQYPARMQPCVAKACKSHAKSPSYEHIPDGCAKNK